MVRPAEPAEVLHGGGAALRELDNVVVLESECPPAPGHNAAAVTELKGGPQMGGDGPSAVDDRARIDPVAYHDLQYRVTEQLAGNTKWHRSDSWYLAGLTRHERSTPKSCEIYATDDGGGRALGCGAPPIPCRTGCRSRCWRSGFAHSFVTVGAPGVGPVGAAVRAATVSTAGAAVRAAGIWAAGIWAAGIWAAWIWAAGAWGHLRCRIPDRAPGPLACDDGNKRIG